MAPSTHYHPIARYDVANNRRRGSDKEQFIFFNSGGLEDNKINTESTRKNHPTKRLDMVDSATGRII